MQQFLPLPEQARPIAEPAEGYRLQRVGDETIELRYPGPNHDTGNILVYAPRHRLAQMSDVVMPGWAPYRGWGNADYPPGILLAHDAILKVDFDTYVGGHVYRTGTRKDVEESQEIASLVPAETRVVKAFN